MKTSVIVSVLLFLAVSASQAAQVNIVLKNGSVVKGNMLGKTAEEIYLQGDNGKAKVFKIGEITALFDADKGTPIDLSVPTNKAASPAESPVVTNAVNLLVVPGTDLYYINQNNEIIYYYKGFWWRSIDGFWYRADIYTGPWAIVDRVYVPYSVYYYGPRWIYFGPRYFYHHHRW